ncbi:MAG: 1-deoxy-D-xylulose-5-phosphate synthase [Oscillospiraceae bacterium]|nr:1-deoxy-D-xylulose-5-phosphate synthase [Oscillospiraceae bacterium]
MSDFLKSINSPEDLRKLSLSQRKELCSEIRDVMIDTVSKTGGHLASNLGIVELTVALHTVFDCPKDTFIFDVGHQCYVHKLLTGRNDMFGTLRQKDGISGFPKPSESRYDSFVEGHASTSISQAIGLAHAKMLSGDHSKTIAVIGDGSFTGGLAFEAMNNLDPGMDDLIVVLNDNSMSISKSVGSVSNYLLRLRTSSGYLKVKKNVRDTIEHVPVLGQHVSNFIRNSKTALRRSIFGGTLFEELGFNYVGPIDGHDLSELELFFRNLKNSTGNGPTFVHVITKKGKGYPLAEENPAAYHGVSKFDVDRGNPDISLADSFSNTFGRTLAELSQRDSRICAVTAAMKYATGLQYFAHLHPDRFFDVGIAEQHAVIMSAGLAKGGQKPVFAVYSTFLQRAMDQLIHDVSLDDIDLLLAVDRAGLVGEDGETHQGLYDAAMLSSIGVFRVVSPSNYRELIWWLTKLIGEKGARAIRYPRGKEDPSLSSYRCTGMDFDMIGEERGDLLFVTYGREFANVLKAQELLKAQGIDTSVLKLNVIAPLPQGAVSAAMPFAKIIFAEEGIKTGGIGEQMISALAERGHRGRALVRAVDTNLVRQASPVEQIAQFGLDAEALFVSAKEMLLEKED